MDSDRPANCRRRWSCDSGVLTATDAEFESVRPGIVPAIATPAKYSMMRGAAIFQRRISRLLISGTSDVCRAYQPLLPRIHINRAGETAGVIKGGLSSPERCI